jgi:acyl-CoA synthetase (AMP-forming)/AMP-acid ligase II
LELRNAALTNAALTVPAVVARAAREFGEAEALAVPGGPRLSYAGLEEQVTAVAGALAGSGISAGDRVALWAPNGAEWMLAALGALSAGGVLVPVSTRFTGSEALDVISRSGARALFVAGNFLGVDRLGALREAAAAPDADGSLDRLALVVRVPEELAEFTSRGAAVAAGVVRARAEAVRPGDVSDIMFTSGTTGRSKGAMTSHERSLAVARAWAECGELTQRDRYLVANPFFHTFGYKAGILACLVSGAALVPQPVFAAGEAMRLVAAERITVLPGAPTIYQMILDHPERDSFDLSSLRLAVTGAADVPVALIERMRRELTFETVLTAYGLTEATGTVTMCRRGDDPLTIATTSGRAIPDTEVRAVDRAGKPLVAGEPGEIMVRGYNVMAGYFDDPVATAETIDSEGWLHTGDIGVIDEHGNVRITDRLKDMFVVGGFNSYPAEIEQQLASHPGIADCAVVGVPDERLGEVGKAYVVALPGVTLDPAEIVAWCRERMANYKAPRTVDVVDLLPRNASGKVLKYELRTSGATAT